MIIYNDLDKVCKKYGLYSLDQAAKIGLDGGDYSGAWDLLEKDNSFANINEAAEIAVIESQERKDEPSEPAPLFEPATEREVPFADIAEPARDIADPVTAGGEDPAFDFSEFDPEDVLGGEGITAKMTPSIRKIGSLPIKRPPKRPHPDLKDRSLPRSKVTG